MRSITTFVSGLLLSAVFLLPAALRAAELQPFFTFKASSVNTFIAIAEKISALAGVADTDEFREVINAIKEIKGFDLSGTIGFAATVNAGGDVCPMFLLPITDLWKAEIPSNPEIFDGLRPFLQRRGQERTDINSPFGTYVVLQKQGYLIIVPEDVIDQVPAEAKKLFADLDKYTLGIKLDLEKVAFETLESQIFGPLTFMAMMSAPEAGEQIEQMVEVYRELSKEFAVVSGGIVFNPQTADIELSGTIVPRKGSDFAKSLAGYKQQPTRFGGFRGTPGNLILSFGDSATQPPLPDQKQHAFMEPSLKQWESILEGFLEQIEMDDETGETTELAKKVIDSAQKIIEIESKRGTSDSALSLNIDGTLLGACDTGALAEIQKLTALIVDFAAHKVASLAADVEIDFNAAVKQDYTTIEGFKVSSFKFPMDKVMPLIPEPDAVEMFKGFSPGVFWAVKDTGGQQAIAVAVGLDFAKAESAFKSALEQTKTPGPVQKPMGLFSVQGLGKFLQQTIHPAAAKGGMPNLTETKQAFDKLAAAGNDATVTVSAEVKPDKIEAGYFISGRAIQAVIAAARTIVPFDRPAIQDF